jgi:hypothetical protein
LRRWLVAYIVVVDNDRLVLVQKVNMSGVAVA